MRVRDLLSSKGKDVVSMEVDSTVEDAIHSMNARKISAMMVTQNGKPVGIFTERDVVKCYVANEGKSFHDVLLQDAMSTDLIVAAPDEEIANVMSIMIQQGIRHLPVTENGKITGMLSIRDVIHSQIGKLKAEIHHLKDYIAGA